VADEAINCVLNGLQIVTAMLLQKPLFNERINLRFVQYDTHTAETIPPSLAIASHALGRGDGLFSFCAHGDIARGYV
jgi:uncharacterized protein YegL